MSIKINISQSKKKIIVYIVLTLVTLAVYWQVNKYDFVNFDDPFYVTENSHVQSGITMDGFRWAFRATDKLWTPLLWLSFMLNYQFYGLNAGGYHLTNLILHILSALLLFWLFNRMTQSLWPSAFVAAFFALHPLHVESVAWITERKDVLSAFFWMLTLCLYVYYTEKPVIKRYLLVVFGFVLALMSKPMVVTLPLILILLDYWPLKRFEAKKDNLVLWQLKEKMPFFVLSAVLSVVTFYDSQKISSEHYPFIFRLANATVSFVTYLEKTLWPHDLAIFYPFPLQIPIGQIIGASLLIIAISIAVIAMVKHWPYLFVGWMWFTITILPVTGIIYPLGEYSMADRYHYLPSIGIAIMLAWGIPSLIKKEEMRKNILFPAALVFLIIMSVITWRQCGYWENSVTLFSHALQVTKNNYMTHNDLGITLAKEGKDNAAVYHYNKAINLNPYRALSYFNRGTYYGKTGQHQLAINDFNKAISLNSAYVKAFNNRGIVHTELNLYRKAIDDFNESIRLKPDYTEAYNNRAFAYLMQGDNISGCSDAEKSCKMGICKTLKWGQGKGLCR